LIDYWAQRARLYGLGASGPQELEPNVNLSIYSVFWYCDERDFNLLKQRTPFILSQRGHRKQWKLAYQRPSVVTVTEFCCHQSCQRGGKNAICTHSKSCRLLGISLYAQRDRDRRWRSMIYDAGHRFCNKYITKRLLGKLRASQKSRSHSKDAVLA
jgi:hypothetical protein